MKNHLLLQNPVFVNAKLHNANDVLITTTASANEFSLFQNNGTIAVVFRTILSYVANPAAV